MRDIKTFRRVPRPRGSVPLARGIRCDGTLTRNEAVAWFRRARTGKRYGWITWDAWGEGRYRSCGCGPPDGLRGPDACPGRYDRGCAGARLSEQSPAQPAARLPPGPPRNPPPV